MKKIFTFALSAMFMLGGGSVFAQEEEDMTNYIVNAGFDEDLTWNADGSKKQATATETKSLSTRSNAFIAADGSLYATVASTTDKKRSDGRTFEATNGFVGQIKGWEWVYLNNDGAVPLDATGYPDLSKENARVESKACEWVYFGTVAYGLGETAIPVADDGATYLPGPTVSTEFDYGTGALHLRAGWGNSFAYKQTVKLPCAKYRLEYWTINVNPNTTADGTDLTQIICRRDVFKETDTEGKSMKNTKWTKHEFEFTPTSEFTLIFGFKAGDGGSGATPWVYIDGIKLYKIDEADPEELLMSDILAESEDIMDLSGSLGDYAGLMGEISDAIDEAQDAEGVEAMTEAYKKLQALKAKLADLTALAEEYQSLLENEVSAILDTDNPYPGYDDFASKAEEIQAAMEEEATSETFADYVAQLKKAINLYYTSQEASKDHPADYTFLVDNPTFVQVNPDNSKDLSNSAWYIGQDGGDQRFTTTLTDNNGEAITGWNAWRNNLTSTAQSVSINQDLTELPNGYYTVTADLCTQDGCITDQHVYAKGTASSAESPVMTQTGWEPYVWETLTTGMVLVIDGKLTIGAIGHGAEDTPAENGGTLTDSRRGWFCATGFKLNYLGAATEEEIAAAIAAKFTDAEAYAAKMHLAGDKATFEAAIAKAKAENDLDSLNAAITIAEASEAEYEGIIAGSYKDLTDSISAAKYYSADAKALVQVPVDYMKAYLASAKATYTETGAITTVLRYYRDTLIPALQKAEAAKEEAQSDDAKGVITATIESVKKNLASFKDNKEGYLDEQVAALNKSIDVAKAADVEIKDGADATAYIINPNLDNGTTGWTVNKPVGDGSGVKTSQQYDGNTSGGYIDSYNSEAGKLRMTVYQVLNVPNGTYAIKNIMRTSGTGAYLFVTDQEPVENEEGALTLAEGAKKELAEATLVPTDATKYIGVKTEEGGDSIGNYTDSYGEIWMGAADRIMATLNGDFGMIRSDYNIVEYVVEVLNNGEEECPAGVSEEDWAILKANESKGRGWFHNGIESFEVTNHVLVVGVTCDYAFVGNPEEEAFTGTWFSADKFQLTLTKAGNNDGWNATTGISEVETAAPATSATGIYNLAGQRVNAAYKGIVIKNGKKYLVK